MKLEICVICFTDDLGDVIERNFLIIKVLQELATQVNLMTDDELERRASNCFIPSFKCQSPLYHPKVEDNLLVAVELWLISFIKFILRCGNIFC